MVRLGEAPTRAVQDGLPPTPRYRRPRKTGKTAKPRPKSVDKPQPADPFTVAAIRFVMLTGRREQEALTLRWDAVNVERDVAFVLNATPHGLRGCTRDRLSSAAGS
jgi:hypothetical protein